MFAPTAFWWLFVTLLGVAFGVAELGAVGGLCIRYIRIDAPRVRELPRAWLWKGELR